MAVVDCLAVPSNNELNPVRPVRILLLVPTLLSLAACGSDASKSPVETEDAGVLFSGPDEEDLAETDQVPDIARELRCNGWAHLCERPFDQVVFATTHNAMSSEEQRWVAPNQLNAVPTQLADGIRAFMLDTHEGLAYDTSVCHSECEFGEQELSAALAEINLFLLENPNEVVSIIFEAYISAEATRTAFEESGLLERVYSHPDGAEWPTLGEMSERDERVVVMTSREGGTYGWYHNVWDLAWETHWHNESASDFTCDVNRGDTNNDLFILNHFINEPPIGVAQPSSAEQINYDPFLLERARQCWEEGGQIPNFVTVDFYSIGDVLSAVDALNTELTE